MKHTKVLSVLLLAAAMALPAAGQVRYPDDDGSVPKPPPSEAVQKLVREKLSAGLPVIDKRLLTTYETPFAWEDNLSHGNLVFLLNETPFEWDGRTVPPPEADRLKDPSKVMRIRRPEGEFRYHSRKRVFQPEYKGKSVPSADQVNAQLSGLLKRLGFPLGEAGKNDVQVQETAVSGADGNVAEKFPVYAFFQLRRQVAGFPVEGSTVRAAVNHRGEIQRLKISWPHFKPRAGAQLLARERVIEEAAHKIFAQDPSEKLQMASRLVYTKSAKGDFLPAVQIDVNDGETPYRLTIPVAN